MSALCCCFFFQAEDGIRDRTVTGVQTCALPISGICVFFAAAITIAIVFFFFKYHRKDSNAVGIVTHEDSRLEAVWKIGRASCRERVEVSAVDDAWSMKQLDGMT